QHRHDQLDGADALGGVDVGGDAATVVGHFDGVVRRDDDVNARAVTGQRFVHGVVHHLVHEVVQAAPVGGTDVHRGPLADGLEALEDLDVACAVTLLSVFHVSPWLGRAMARPCKTFILPIGDDACVIPAGG